MKITFLCPRLDRGGAEHQLVLLANGLAARGHDVVVVELKGRGALSVDLLGCRSLHGFGAFIRSLRREPPDIVHGVMAVANIASVLTHPFARRSAVVFGVRGTLPERSLRLRRVRALYHLEARLSRTAALTITNSYAARDLVVKRGFPPNRVIVVENGIDTERFQPNPAARIEIREELGIADNELIVGRVGGLRPIKDYPTFLRAARTALERRADLWYVCVGDGPERERLTALASELGIAKRVLWLGERADISRVTAAFDVAVSSSSAESFPNVLGEAMACGVPCAATAAGDSARIIGETGSIAPVGNPRELARSMSQVIDRLGREGQSLQDAARSRVVQEFSVERMIERSEEALEHRTT